MKLELVKATIAQKPIIANLLELYAYDFSEFCYFDIGDDGLYGYPNLSQYWRDSNKHPFLIYVDNKIAGLILVQQGSPISNKPDVWDVAEFFIMRKYRRDGMGTTAAIKIWEQLKGTWQVRVLKDNPAACSFWLKTIKTFSSTTPYKQKDIIIENEHWIIYTFSSK